MEPGIYSNLLTTPELYVADLIPVNLDGTQRNQRYCIYARSADEYWNLKQGKNMAEQRTYEWFAARFGKITMSKRVDILLNGHVHDLNNMLKAIIWEHQATPDQIRAEFERETRIGDNSPAMSWGKRHEEEAITHYELTRNVQVIRAEFKPHNLWPHLAGDSTDFLETEDGTLKGKVKYACEVKCPFNSDYHKKSLRYGMAHWHHNQTQGHMEVHGLTEGKFVSYDPRHTIEEQQIYVQAVEVDLAWQKLFREKMQEFNDHFQNGTQYEQQMTKATDGIPSMF